MAETCLWKRHDDLRWESSCKDLPDNLWKLGSNTPNEAGMMFCPMCGKAIVTFSNVFDQKLSDFVRGEAIMLALPTLILKRKTVIDVFAVNPPGKEIASIFLEDKYITFYDEFSQIGVDIPEMKELIDSGEYEHNHT